MAAGKFTPEITNTTTCADLGVTGPFSTKFDYILKSSTGDSDYPAEACTPYIHYNIQAGNLKLDQNILSVINITGSGNCTFPTFTGNLIGNVTGVASGNKTLASFDIPHVKDKKKRIRHIVAEGPEPGIYIRGQLKDTNVIELPEYWDGLIDPETLYLDREKYDVVGRLYADLYAPLREVFSLKSPTQEEWLEKHNKKVGD